MIGRARLLPSRAPLRDGSAGASPSQIRGDAVLERYALVLAMVGCAGAAAGAAGVGGG